jgi:hypothetical protein
VSSSSDTSWCSTSIDSEYHDIKDHHGGIAATTATSQRRIDVVVVGCTGKMHARRYRHGRNLRRSGPRTTSKSGHRARFTPPPPLSPRRLHVLLHRPPLTLPHRLLRLSLPPPPPHPPLDPLPSLLKIARCRKWFAIVQVRFIIFGENRRFAVLTTSRW